MSDGRLPNGQYPPGLGPYPNPALTCCQCGQPEGEPHVKFLGKYVCCDVGEPVVYFAREAYEAGFRAARRRQRAVLNAILPNPARANR